MKENMMGNNLHMGNYESKILGFVMCELMFQLQKLSKRLVLAKGPLSCVAPLMEGVPWLDRKLPLQMAALGSIQKMV